MINPLISPGEGVTVFTSPYLSEGAPAQDEAKGLIKCISIISFSSIVRESLDKIVEFLTLIKFMFCLVL